MGKVNYSTTTVKKDGTLVEGDVTYNVSATIVNNELQRLSCSILEEYTENHTQSYIGSITFDNGRQITDINQGEDLIPHLTIFNEIVEATQSEIADKATVEL